MKYLKKTANLEHMKKTLKAYYDYISKPKAEWDHYWYYWHESNVRIVFRETFTADVEFPDRDINHILKYLESKPYLKISAV